MGMKVGVLGVLMTIGLALAGGTSAGAAPSGTTLKGSIESIGASTVLITTDSGDTIQAKTTSETHIISRQPAHLADVTTGNFVGVAARKEADGSLTAVDINIFPTALRGQIREGQWPMETGNIMTNAVVTQEVSRVSGRTVYLAYKDGTAMIDVPSDAVVHRMTVITLGDLKAGMRVTVFGTKNSDGSMTASFLIMEASGG